VKKRLARLQTVQQLIKTYRIDSQERLLSYLERAGFPITQATLSRDLKFLKVGKVSDENGYVYALSEGEEPHIIFGGYINDFLRGYVSIEWSGNMVVIKTYSGHSDSVALALDNMELTEVLGTIAGRDDAVFVCLQEGITGEDFMNRIKKIIPKLERVKYFKPKTEEVI
jgi:transcriptional regulator of arginine metabolism